MQDWEIIPSSVNKADQPWALLTAVLMPLCSTMCYPFAWKWCFSCCTLGGRPGSSAPSQDDIHTPKRTVSVTEQSRNVTRGQIRAPQPGWPCCPATKPQHIKTDSAGQAPALCGSCTELSMLKNTNPLSFSITHCRAAKTLCSLDYFIGQTQNLLKTLIYQNSEDS